MADEKNNNGNSNIFRQKSLDRVSSPEDLDKYIKTTTPSLWLLLASIIVFLIGVIVWASFGKIETSSVVGCTVSSKLATCYIKEEDVDKIIDSSYISLEDDNIEIVDVVGPTEAKGNSSVLHNSSIEDGTWYYEVIGYTTLNSGIYKGKVVFEKISPITFVIN